MKLTKEMMMASALARQPCSFILVIINSLPSRCGPDVVSVMEARAPSAGGRSFSGFGR